MKVKELRDALAAFPDEALVFGRDDGDPDAGIPTADYDIVGVDLGDDFVMLVLEY